METFILIVELGPYAGMPAENFPEPNVYGCEADAKQGVRDIMAASSTVERVRVYEVLTAPSGHRHLHHRWTVFPNGVTVDISDHD